ncbi:hypothetical protein OS42_46590 [Dickeya oryzae]
MNCISIRNCPIKSLKRRKKIRAVLEKEGIRILELPLKTGLVAEVGGLQEGPLVVVRSDIDALPIEEESGVEFSSKKCWGDARLWARFSLIGGAGGGDPAQAY